MEYFHIFYFQTLEDNCAFYKKDMYEKVGIQKITPYDVLFRFFDFLNFVFEKL